MNTNNKAAAVLLLLLGGMASALGFGVICLMLSAVGGGIGAVVMPLVIYTGVRFSEKYRERFRQLHDLNSVAFIVIAELPSVLVSAVWFLLLICNAEGGDLLDIAGELLAGVIAMFWGGATLLIMLGTVICSIVTYITRKKILSQPPSAEEMTEV